MYRLLSSRPPGLAQPHFQPRHHVPTHETATLHAAVSALAARRDALAFPLTHGSALAVAAEHVPGQLAAATRLAQPVLDHRYYQVAHRTLGTDFELKYLLLRDTAGEFRGLHPFFMLRQDLLAGVPGKVTRLAGRVRRSFPRFLTLKTLMLGNPAGPATLGLRTHNAGPDDAPWTARALAEGIDAYARHHRVKIVVFKDFASADRPLLQGLTDPINGYARLPSMPMTRLPLAGYQSFEDYLQRTLSKVTRKGMRRKLKEAAALPLRMTVTNDISDCVEEVYRLYLQVYQRATLKFEKLSPEFLLELCRRMPDRARFFLWRLDGRLIAASVTLVNTEDNGTESALYDLYLGMEYPLALDLHLYFVTMRDVLEWCIANGVQTYYSTPLNYDAKLHFKHLLVPQDLYVRHISPLLNPGFKWAMRFAEPTRHDKILPRFPNAHELRG